MKITNSLGQVIISEDNYQVMIANGLRAYEVNRNPEAKSGEHDPVPVVKLFTPDSGATWLLSELDPENRDCFLKLYMEQS